MKGLIGNWNIFISVILIVLLSAFKSYPVDQDMQIRSLLYSYDIKSYVLDLSVNDTSIYIEGSAEINLSVLEPVDRLVLELSDHLKVDSVVLNNSQKSYIHKNDFIIVELERSFDKNEVLNPKIYYKGYAEDEKWFGGINNEYYFNGKQPVTYTLSEPYSAKNWFPCKQVLTDKADSVIIRITTDPDLMAVSNGLLYNKRILPDDQIQYEWKSKYPVAYYLIAFAVSDFDEFHFYKKTADKKDSLLFSNYFFNENDYLQKPIGDIKKAADIVELFSGLFGKYPFYNEKYGQVFTPFQGGMENQTITYIRDFDDEIVVHEIGHHWFGDHVTCETFNDIWINEGFATYSEYLALEFLPEKFSEKKDGWLTEIHKRAKRNSDLALYVSDHDVNDENIIFNYDVTYAKGASFIHMIRHIINNDSLFFSVLKDFQSEYSFLTATALDFKKMLEEKSDKNFSDDFEQWYFGKGYPELDFTWNYEKKTFYLNVLQSVTATDVTPFFNLDIDVKLIHAKGDTVITVHPESKSEIFKMDFPQKIIRIEIDPDQWLLYELTGIKKGKIH